MRDVGMLKVMANQSLVECEYWFKRDMLRIKVKLFKTLQVL